MTRASLSGQNPCKLLRLTRVDLDRDLIPSTHDPHLSTTRVTGGRYSPSWNLAVSQVVEGASRGNCPVMVRTPEGAPAHLHTLGRCASGTAGRTRAALHCHVPGGPQHLPDGAMGRPRTKTLGNHAMTCPGIRPAVFLGAIRHLMSEDQTRSDTPVITRLSFHPCNSRPFVTKAGYF